MTQNGLVQFLQLIEGEIDGKQFKAQGLIANPHFELFNAFGQDFVVVKGQISQFREGMPLHIVGPKGSTGFVVLHPDQGIVSHRDDPTQGVSIHFAKGLDLLHKDLPDAGEIFEYTLSGTVQIFLGIDQVTRQGPKALVGRHAPFD